MNYHLTANNVFNCLIALLKKQCQNYGYCRRLNKLLSLLNNIGIKILVIFPFFMDPFTLALNN